MLCLAHTITRTGKAWNSSSECQQQLCVTSGSGAKLGFTQPPPSTHALSQDVVTTALDITAPIRLLPAIAHHRHKSHCKQPRPECAPFGETLDADVGVVGLFSSTMLYFVAVSCSISRRIKLGDGDRMDVMLISTTSMEMQVTGTSAIRNQYAGLHARDGSKQQLERIERLRK